MVIIQRRPLFIGYQEVPHGYWRVGVVDSTTRRATRSPRHVPIEEFAEWKTELSVGGRKKKQKRARTTTAADVFATALDFATGPGKEARGGTRMGEETEGGKRAS